MSLILTQYEADILLAIEKHDFDGQRFFFPSLGGSIRMPLYSADKREEFNLDVTRGRITLEKTTYQSRARKAVVLARLDLSGPPHRNPDGIEISCPHLHLYRQGFGDKWAVPMPDIFVDLNDPVDMLSAFMDYCAIVTKPTIDKELF